MVKLIIMYRTAIMAQSKKDTTKCFGTKASCVELIKSFNKGSHIIDEANEQNCYSILK